MEKEDFSWEEERCKIDEQKAANQLRIRSLELALTFKQGDTTADHKNIIEIAESFHTFLKGS